MLLEERAYPRRARKAEHFFPVAFVRSFLQPTVANVSHHQNPPAILRAVLSWRSSASSLPTWLSMSARPVSILQPSTHRAGEYVATRPKNPFDRLVDLADRFLHEIRRRWV